MSEQALGVAEADVSMAEQAPADVEVDVSMTEQAPADIEAPADTKADASMTEQVSVDDTANIDRKAEDSESTPVVPSPIAEPVVTLASAPGPAAAPEPAPPPAPEPAPAAAPEHVPAKAAAESTDAVAPVAPVSSEGRLLRVEAGATPWSGFYLKAEEVYEGKDAFVQQVANSGTAHAIYCRKDVWRVADAIGGEIFIARQKDPQGPETGPGREPWKVWHADKKNFGRPDKPIDIRRGEAPYLAGDKVQVKFQGHDGEEEWRPAVFRGHTEDGSIKIAWASNGTEARCTSDEVKAIEMAQGAAMELDAKPKVETTAKVREPPVREEMPETPAKLRKIARPAETGKSAEVASAAPKQFETPSKDLQTGSLGGDRPDEGAGITPTKDTGITPTKESHFSEEGQRLYSSLLTVMFREMNLYIEPETGYLDTKKQLLVYHHAAKMHEMRESVAGALRGEVMHLANLSVDFQRVVKAFREELKSQGTLPEAEVLTAKKIFGHQHAIRFHHPPNVPQGARNVCVYIRERPTARSDSELKRGSWFRDLVKFRCAGNPLGWIEEPGLGLVFTVDQVQPRAFLVLSPLLLQPQAVAEAAAASLTWGQFEDTLSPYATEWIANESETWRNFVQRHADVVTKVSLQVIQKVLQGCQPSYEKLMSAAESDAINALRNEAEKKEFRIAELEAQVDELQDEASRTAERSDTLDFMEESVQSAEKKAKAAEKRLHAFEEKVKQKKEKYKNAEIRVEEAETARLQAEKRAETAESQNAVYRSQVDESYREAERARERMIEKIEEADTLMTSYESLEKNYEALEARFSKLEEKYAARKEKELAKRKELEAQLETQLTKVRKEDEDHIEVRRAKLQEEIDTQVEDQLRKKGEQLREKDVNLEARRAKLQEEVDTQVEEQLRTKGEEVRKKGEELRIMGEHIESRRAKLQEEIDTQVEEQLRTKGEELRKKDDELCEKAERVESQRAKLQEEIDAKVEAELRTKGEELRERGELLEAQHAKLQEEIGTQVEDQLRKRGEQLGKKAELVESRRAGLQQEIDAKVEKQLRTKGADFRERFELLEARRAKLQEEIDTQVEEQLRTKGEELRKKAERVESQRAALQQEIDAKVEEQLRMGREELREKDENLESRRSKLQEEIDTQVEEQLRTKGEELRKKGEELCEKAERVESQRAKLQEEIAAKVDEQLHTKREELRERGELLEAQRAKMQEEIGTQVEDQLHKRGEQLRKRDEELQEKSEQIEARHAKMQEEIDTQTEAQLRKKGALLERLKEKLDVERESCRNEMAQAHQRSVAADRAVAAAEMENARTCAELKCKTDALEALQACNSQLRAQAAQGAVAVENLDKANQRVATAELAAREASATAEMQLKAKDLQVKDLMSTCESLRAKLVKEDAMRKDGLAVLENTASSLRDTNARLQVQLTQKDTEHRVELSQRDSQLQTQLTQKDTEHRVEMGLKESQFKVQVAQIEKQAQERVDAAERAVTSAELEHARIDGELRCKADALNSVQAANVQLRIQLAEASQHVKEADERAAAAGRAADDLQEVVAQKETQLKEKNTQVKELTVSCDSLKAEAIKQGIAAKEHVAAAERALSGLRDTNAQLQVKLTQKDTEMQVELANRDERLAAVQNTLATTERSEAQARAELQVKSDTVEQLRASNTSLRTECAEAKEQASQAKKNEEAAKKNEEAAKKAAADARETNAEKDMKLKAWEVSVKELTAFYESAQEESAREQAAAKEGMAAAEQTVSEMRDTNARIQAESQLKLAEKDAEFLHQMTKKNERLAAVEDALANAERTAAQARAELQVRSETVEGLMASNAALRTEMTEAKQMAENAEKRAADAEQAERDNRDLRVKMMESRAQARAELQEKIDEISKLSVTHEALQQELQSAKASVAEANDRAVQAEEAAASSRNEEAKACALLEVKAAEATSLTASCAMLRAEVDSIREQSIQADKTLAATMHDRAQARSDLELTSRVAKRMGFLCEGFKARATAAEELAKSLSVQCGELQARVEFAEQQVTDLAQKDLTRLIQQPTEGTTKVGAPSTGGNTQADVEQAICGDDLKTTGVEQAIMPVAENATATSTIEKLREQFDEHVASIVEQKEDSDGLVDAASKEDKSRREELEEVMTEADRRHRQQILQDLPLPDGWKSAVDPDGDVYYYKKGSTKTQWEHPLAGDSKQTALPATDNKALADMLREELGRNKDDMITDADIDKAFQPALRRAIRLTKKTKDPALQIYLTEPAGIEQPDQVDAPRKSQHPTGLARGVDIKSRGMIARSKAKSKGRGGIVQGSSKRHLVTRAIEKVKKGKGKGAQRLSKDVSKGSSKGEGRKLSTTKGHQAKGPRLRSKSAPEGRSSAAAGR